MAQLPLLSLPEPAARPNPLLAPTLAFVSAVAVGLVAGTAGSALFTTTRPAVQPLARSLPIQRTLAVRNVPQSVDVLAPRPVVEATEAITPATSPLESLVKLGAVAVGLLGLVVGTQRVMAMLPLSGLRGTMEPFLDAIENEGTRHMAQDATYDMLQAEAQGDNARVLAGKTALAGAMMMVSWEAVKKAARVQIACGTITVHSFVDSILVHAVPPLPESDGIVHTSVLDVCEGRFWKQPELWDVSPLLKVLHDCEVELRVDLADVLLGLMSRYCGCVSYCMLESCPDYLTETEFQALKYLTIHCFDTSVPYVHVD